MNKIIIALLVVNLVLGVIGLFLPTAGNILGGTTRSSLTSTGNLEAQGELRGNTLNVTSTSVFGGAITAASADLSGEFQAAIIDEGTLVTLTAGTTSSITAAQACDANVISFAPQAVGASTTLPASSAVTGDCLDTNGDTVSFLFRNTSSTGASTTIKAADASSTLVGVDGSSDEIGGGMKALITIYRTGADTLDIVIRRFLDAD